VTNLDEPGWQHVQQKAAEELNRIEAHDFDAVVVPGITPAKAHLAIQAQQSTVGNSDAIEEAQCRHPKIRTTLPLPEEICRRLTAWDQNCHVMKPLFGRSDLRLCRRKLQRGAVA